MAVSTVKSVPMTRILLSGGHTFDVALDYAKVVEMLQVPNDPLVPFEGACACEFNNTEVSIKPSSVVGIIRVI